MIGVKYGPWDIRHENGCYIGRNIIDADNWNWYTFWVEPLVIKVIAAPGLKIASATIAAEGGPTRNLTCLGQYCIMDRDYFDDGLETGSYADIDIKLHNGQRAGPFRMPFEELSALLFFCGDKTRVGPPKPKHYNPEPQVNPQPSPK